GKRPTWASRCRDSSKSHPTWRATLSYRRRLPERTSRSCSTSCSCRRVSAATTRRHRVSSGGPANEMLEFASVTVRDRPDDSLALGGREPGFHLLDPIAQLCLVDYAVVIGVDLIELVAEALRQVVLR